jgi:thiamine biosynthesis protein ThiI
MLLGAYSLVKISQADFIVNGDILGEQASQTLDNIAVIQKIMAKIPVIRPLIGFEKKDILKLSHELGFYELSTLPDAQCTFNPMYPETHAKSDDIQFSFNHVDLDTIVQTSLKNAQVLIVE